MYYKKRTAIIDPDGLYYGRKTGIMEAAVRVYAKHFTGYVCNKGSPDQPQDERGRWTSEGGSGSNISGAISGALKPDSKRAQEHADRYYESVRHMTNDVNRIASNTGFSVEDISIIKDFVFMQKHELDGKIERFAPSFEMSQSWQRLIDGKNIQPHDITLLKHELMERELMKKGFSQDEAHIRTSQKYNYAREAAEYYDKIDSDNKS